MVIDPIGDMFSAIKNALKRGYEYLYVPSSKQKEEILRVLKEEGFIRDYEPLKDEKFEEEKKRLEELSQKSPNPIYKKFLKQLLSYKKGTQYPIKIYLKYLDEKRKKPAISEIRRVSKPGLRIYAPYKKIPYVKRGLGIAIVSTDAGIITDHKARELKKGGEIIGFVW